MSHNINNRRDWRSTMPLTQRGFSIVAAIFLLVVLSALGAFMLTFSTVQHTTSAQDLQGSRAYQAARAGVEWGAYRALVNAACPFAATTLPPLAGTLGTFTVTVQCQSTPYTEGTFNGSVHTITSTAREGVVGSTNFVERQLQATLAN